MHTLHYPTEIVVIIPVLLIHQLFFPHHLPSRHLVYIEWFSPFPPNPMPHSLMYKVTRMLHHGFCIASIIPIHGLIWSVHLIPKWGPLVPRNWTSENVLEECFTFLVNPWTDRHAYILIH